jgi:16S rRNA processing protein RimM
MSGPQPPQADGYLTLGQIAGPHGVRGWMKVNSFTDPPEALLETPDWTLIRPDGRRLEVEVVEAGAGQRSQLRVALATVADRDAAQALAGSWVLVSREDLPAPGEREHYRDDLLGFEVRNVEGVELGRLSHYVDLPAGAVMVVRGGKAEHWIPAAPAHLKKVEKAERRLLVDWPETL